MLKRVEFKTKEEWLEGRKPFVAATELSAVLGLDYRTTGNRLIKLKKGLIEETKLNDGQWVNFRRGHILECSVAKALEYDLGWDVKFVSDKEKIVMFYDDEIMLASTPDVFNSQGVPVELKTTSEKVFNKMWRKGEPPIKYLVQLLVQMLTTSTTRDKGYLTGMAVYDIHPARMREEFPDYNSINPTIDVMEAVYELNYVQELEDIVQASMKIWNDCKISEQMYRSNTEVTDRAKLLLRQNSKLIHLVESVPYIEDWKPPQFEEKIVDLFDYEEK